MTPPLPRFAATLLLLVLLLNDQDEDCVTEPNESHTKRFAVEVVREYGPLPDAGNVDGVTYDGRHVRFAAGGQLKELDPDGGEAQRSIDVPTHAGTAFDGRYLLQITEDRIQKIDP